MAQPSKFRDDINSVEEASRYMTYVPPAQKKGSGVDNDTLLLTLLAVREKAKTVDEMKRAVNLIANKLGQSDSKAFSVDDEEHDDTELVENEDERNKLMAEILVMLFGDNAEDETRKILEDDAPLSIMFGPKVTKRYGKKPGPGWTSGGVSRTGTPIWIHGSSGGSGAAQPTPTPRQPAATPAPQPAPQATPQATPQAQPSAQATFPPFPGTAAPPGGKRPSNGQVAADTHKAVMARLNAGVKLSASEIATLARRLNIMSVPHLTEIHKALGGTSAVAGKAALVANVGALLTPGTSTPVPTPQPTVPTPQPAPVAPAPAPAYIPIGTPVKITSSGKTGTVVRPAMPTSSGLQFYVVMPNGLGNWYKATDVTVTQPSTPTPAPQPLKFTRPPVAATATPSTATLPPIPFADETSWDTGTPKPGSLHGIDFKPAPPKFWEKTPDVDVKEPKPLRKVDRVGIMIQEEDGRVWIVEPTNGFGNRKYTMPGGGVEAGLTDQQNALKEVWEETGLQVEITGFAGDFEDSNNGNNGRLYIGKRVGGAPWDAKVESFIISQKTGKPAAESDKVSLVTPDRAAQLLHRTDDLAQLATVRPIKIDAPTRGTGSQVVKNILKAIAPKAADWKKKKDAAGEYHGNNELHAVQDMRGFNKPPKLVSEKDFDAMIAKGGHIEMARGVSSVYNSVTRKDITGPELADQFRKGDHFPGHGIFGSGTYADSTKGYNNVCQQYAGYGSRGAVIRMALPKTAKIIKVSELEKLVPKCPDDFVGYANGKGKDRDECWLGVQAALAGYDAIHQDGNSRRHGAYGKDFYVILNRGALVCQETNAKAGYYP